MKYLDPIIQVNNHLAHIVYSSIKGGSFPLVLGGDNFKDDLIQQVSREYLEIN
jgi:hypothetical protein